MFFHLILENESGDRIDMTTTANRYMTSKVEGLSPPPCTISTSSYAGMDGSKDLQFTDSQGGRFAGCLSGSG